MTPGCEGKTRYQGKIECVAVLIHRKKRRAKRGRRGSARVPDLSFYRCEACGFWHIGGRDRP